MWSSKCYWYYYDVDNLHVYHNSYYNQIRKFKEVTCECGKIIAHCSLIRHKKRAIHLNRMKLLEITSINVEK